MGWAAIAGCHELWPGGQRVLPAAGRQGRGANGGAIGVVMADERREVEGGDGGGAGQ
jgi:hypothetical protein